MIRPVPHPGRPARPCAQCPHWPSPKLQGWCPIRAEYRIASAPSCAWGQREMDRAARRQAKSPSRAARLIFYFLIWSSFSTSHHDVTSYSIVSGGNDDLSCNQDRLVSADMTRINRSIERHGAVFDGCPIRTKAQVCAGYCGFIGHAPSPPQRFWDNTSTPCRTRGGAASGHRTHITHILTEKETT